jgi:murein DD-endopeptidase MepM/ murein hydrolase activator NlpD
MQLFPSTLHAGIAEWQSSSVPRHRRRSGPSRFFLPAALGAMALSAAGSVTVGTLFPPSPAGAVEAVQGGPGPTSDGAASRDTTVVRSAATAPPAIPIDPVVVAAPGFGGVSIEARDHAALHPAPPPLAELSGYEWPLPNGRITLPFGPSRWGSRVVAGEPFHDGLDLATFCGDRIVAAHDGIVLTAGRRYDTQMGWIGDLQPYLDRLEAKALWSTLPIVIVIDDGNGYRSMYAHLSKTVVKRGDTVEAGDLIGYEGRTGRASGCHLHYGLFSPLETARFGIDPGVVERMLLPAWQTARVDPLLVLPERRSGESTPRAWPSYEGPSGKEPLAE